MFRSATVCAAAMLTALLMSAAAPGQVIYEPVQYQYGTGCQYYYGGRDPKVVARADRLAAMGNRVEIDGNCTLVANNPIYSDWFPYQDPALFGFTAADACNEANSNVPRYFRKRELLEQGIAVSRTMVVVPWIFPSDNDGAIGASARPR